MLHSDSSSLTQVRQKLADLEQELLHAGISTDLMRPVKDTLETFCLQFEDELQQRLREYAEQHHRMELAIDAAGIGIWELDFESNDLVWDKWMYRLYGIDPETFSGAYEAWQNGLHPDDREGAIRDVHEAVADVRPFDTRFRVVHPSGEIRYIRAHAVITRDEAGNPLKMTGINYDITEQTIAEMEVLTQKKLLEEVIEGTQAGTWRWHVESGEATFNELWANLLGYRLEELSPLSIETWTGLVHPEDIAGCQHLLEQHFQGTVPYYDCEARMKHKDGSWVWVQARGRVIEWSDDRKPLVMSGTHQDISERKQLEQAVSTKMKQLDALYNGITDAIVIADIETRRILNCNHVAEELTGLDSEVLQTMYVDDLHPLNVHQETMQAFQRQADGIQRVVETEVLAASGKTIPVSILTSRIEFNERSCLMGVFRDISESKEAERELRNTYSRLQATNQQLQASEQQLMAANQQLQASEQQLMAANQQLQASEQQLMAANQQLQASEQQLMAANQQLQASEAKYRLIFENMQDVYAEMDLATGLFDEISSSISQYGYSREDMLHTPAREYFADVAEWEDFLSSLQAKRALQDYELRLLKKDGSIVTGSLSGALYQFTHDSSVKIAGTIRDISARKEHELQIRENLKLKNDFISSVSHELRTPLFSILGFSSMLLKDNDTLDSATRHEFTSIIHDESSRLSSLIEDLLTISRIESGKAKYRPEPISLVDLVTGVTDILRRQAAEKNLKLHEEYGDQHVLIRFDKDSLKQVVMNLLGNALKFTLPGGSIWIKVFTQGDSACLEVKDTGIGIDASDLDNIFKKFYRSEHREITVEGTGLGLAIVKEILESQGGRVSVESELDRGSTFTAMLPLA